MTEFLSHNRSKQLENEILQRISSLEQRRDKNGLWNRMTKLPLLQNVELESVNKAIGYLKLAMDHIGDEQPEVTMNWMKAAKEEEIVSKEFQRLSENKTSSIDDKTVEISFRLKQRARYVYYIANYVSKSQQVDEEHGTYREEVMNILETISDIASSTLACQALHDATEIITSLLTIATEQNHIAAIEYLTQAIRTKESEAIFTLTDFTHSNSLSHRILDTYQKIAHFYFTAAERILKNANTEAIASEYAGIAEQLHVQVLTEYTTALKQTSLSTHVFHRVIENTHELQAKDAEKKLLQRLYAGKTRSEQNRLFELFWSGNHNTTSTFQQQSAAWKEQIYNRTGLFHGLHKIAYWCGQANRLQGDEKMANLHEQLAVLHANEMMIDTFFHRQARDEMKQQLVCFVGEIDGMNGQDIENNYSEAEKEVIDRLHDTIRRQTTSSSASIPTNRWQEIIKYMENFADTKYAKRQDWYYRILLTELYATLGQQDNEENEERFNHLIENGQTILVTQLLSCINKFLEAKDVTVLANIHSLCTHSALYYLLVSNLHFIQNTDTLFYPYWSIYAPIATLLAPQSRLFTAVGFSVATVCVPLSSLLPQSTELRYSVLILLITSTLCLAMNRFLSSTETEVLASYLQTLLHELYRIDLPRDVSECNHDTLLCCDTLMLLQKATLTCLLLAKWKQQTNPTSAISSGLLQELENSAIQSMETYYSSMISCPNAAGKIRECTTVSCDFSLMKENFEKVIQQCKEYQTTPEDKQLLEQVITAQHYWTQKQHWIELEQWKQPLMQSKKTLNDADDEDANRELDERIVQEFHLLIRDKIRSNLWYPAMQYLQQLKEHDLLSSLPSSSNIITKTQETLHWFARSQLDCWKYWLLSYSSLSDDDNMDEDDDDNAENIQAFVKCVLLSYAEVLEVLGIAHSFSQSAFPNGNNNWLRWIAFIENTMIAEKNISVITKESADEATEKQLEHQQVIIQEYVRTQENAIKGILVHTITISSV